MSLPERLYYPLAKAAEKLGYSVDDLIHFAAYGKLEICAKIHSDALLEYPPEQLFEQLEQFEKALSNYYLKTEFGGLYWRHDIDFDDDTYLRHGSYLNYAKRKRRLEMSVNTLVAIPQGPFREIANLGNRENVVIKIRAFELPRGYKLNWRVLPDNETGVFLDENLGKKETENPFWRASNSLKIPFSSLAVTTMEINRFKADGKKTEETDIALLSGTINNNIEASRSESLPSSLTQEVELRQDNSETQQEYQPKIERQKHRILQWIRLKGYDPKNLPNRQGNAPGVKTAILKLALAEKTLFSSKSTFDNAWRKLRSENEIA